MITNRDGVRLKERVYVGRGLILVRDTKDRTAGALSFPAGAWSTFLASIK